MCYPVTFSDTRVLLPQPGRLQPTKAAWRTDTLRLAPLPEELQWDCELAGPRMSSHGLPCNITAWPKVPRGRSGFRKVMISR